MNRELQMARRIGELVAKSDGQAFFVGGYVRDSLLGLDTTDMDIEVHGISPSALESILDTLGQRIEIGKSFGVYNLKGYSLDIAMPRKEKALGMGHRDFSVEVDPFIGTKQAAMRRDFTVNALMQDILAGQIIDHFGGLKDISAGLIRHVNDDSFPEDPLRVLRAAQFAARFGFTVADETIALCRRMQLGFLPGERIAGELKKALTKSDHPSVFFEVLRKMEQLDIWFPEVKALIGVPQNPVYHGEGDVWNHTMLVMDQAAGLREKAQNPYGFMLAALTHDFGKAVCTEEQNGVLHSYDHEQKGIPLAETFLRRFTRETRLIDYVKNMVLLHMKPNTLAHANSTVKATNRLFDQSVDPEGLICLALADDRGRITERAAISTEPFLRDRLEIFREYMSRPYVAGRDLLGAGLQPGKNFSDILAYAHKLRLAGVEKGSALKQCLSYAKTLPEKL